MSQFLQELVDYYYSCYSIRKTAEYFHMHQNDVKKYLNNLGFKTLNSKEARTERNKLKYGDNLYEKTCRKCKIKQDRSNFNPDNRNIDNLTTWCKTCRYANIYKYRHKANLSQYNMTPDDYNKILKLQNYCCAICKSKDPGHGRKHFCVDHDHETKLVRGLLCNPCNTDIADKKLSVLIQAIHYKLNPPTKHLNIKVK